MVDVIEFYADVASPYSYIAYTQLETLKQLTGADIILKAISLKNVLELTNNSFPASCLAKSRHITDDLSRLSHYYNIPMKMPFVEVRFPINTHIIMELCAAKEQHPEVKHIMDIAYNAYWVEAMRIDKPDVLYSILPDYHEDIKKIIEKNDSSQLLLNTEEAVERGAYGAPTFFVGQEMFFGSDRFHLIEDYYLQRKVSSKLVV